MSNEKIHRSDFLKNILALLTGSAAAHIITIVSLPILQKYFFSTQDFADYVWFFEFVTVFVSVGSLRLETGIVIERHKGLAEKLTIISLKLMLIAALVGTLVAILGSLIDPTFKVILNSPIYFILIPISILALGNIQVLNSWFTSEEKFKYLASNKIYQTTASSVIQLTVGATKMFKGGLVIGRTIGLSIVSLLMLKKFLGSRMNAEDTISDRDLIRKNMDFIKFTTPSTFLGNLINFIYIDLFIRFFGEDLTGNMASSKQYLAMGITFIAGAFAQVFYSAIAKETTITSLKKQYTYWFKRLGLVSLIGVALVLIIPNNLVTWILGDEWSAMIPAMRIMAIWMSIMFVASSLSHIYIKLNRQKELIFFDLFHLMLTVLSISISHYLYHDFWITLYWFTAAKTFYYLFAICMTYYFFNHPKGDNFSLNSPSENN